MDFPKRFLGGGRVLMVMPLLFGQARLVLGTAGSKALDDAW